MTTTVTRTTASHAAPVCDAPTAQRNRRVLTPGADAVRTDTWEMRNTDDTRARALEVLRHESVRADAERRLLGARGAGAFGGVMWSR